MGKLNGSKYLKPPNSHSLHSTVSYLPAGVRLESEVEDLNTLVATGMSRDESDTLTDPALTRAYFSRLACCTYYMLCS